MNYVEHLVVCSGFSYFYSLYNILPSGCSLPRLKLCCTVIRCEYSSEGESFKIINEVIDIGYDIGC